MEFLGDRDVQRMLEDSQLVVGSAGTTRLLLRQPLPPDGKVSPNLVLDPDFKTPISSTKEIPYRERPFEAKIRSINDYEASQTGVGEVQIGDLIADIDPRYYDDAIQPIQTLDEIRFEQPAYIANLGRVETGADYSIYAVIPAWAKNTVVKLKLHLRRKRVATEGSSKLPTV